MTNYEKNLLELLKKIAIEQRYYEDIEIEVEPLSSESCGSANYTTLLFLASISSASRTDVQRLQLFAKVAVTSEKFRSIVQRMFFVENTFYTDIARIYDALQDKHNVRGDDRLVFTKFYGLDPTYMQETIVLENLYAKGFVCHDRLKPVSWEYASKALEELAKFHALSFAYGYHEPAAYQKLQEKFKFSRNMFTNIFRMLWSKTYNAAVDVIKKENKAKLQRFVEKHVADIERFLNYYDTKLRPVLVHGDFRTSNLLHRHCDDGKLQLAIVDYQTVRAGSVPGDLFYFIFSSTDQKFRRQNYERLVELYYERLGRSLGRLGVDVESVYPRDDFDQEMKMVQPFGLHVAMSTLNLVMAREHSGPELDENYALSDLLMATDEQYVARLNEVVDDYVALGLL